MSNGALEGIRVIELGQLVSAPYCGKLFSDFGADVVKVEPPGGDLARRWGPFPDDVPHPEKSGLYHYLNSNKRGVTLDLDSAGDRERFQRLIESADVLIENHLPKRMREWGLDYERLSAINPDLVMISITPFGQTGPYSEWNGYDLNAFHLTGAGSRYCGQPDRAPLEQGTFAAEFFGAGTGAAWGLAAVIGRERVGTGQHVDVSCAEAIAATFTGGQNIGGYAQDGVFDRRTGIGMSQAAPASIMACKDGHVWMLALEVGQWRGLVEVMGNPDWANLEMFDDMFTRGENGDLIYAMLGEWTAERSKWEIMESCQAAGCPASAVFTIEEAAEHPHLKERGYIVELEHDLLGTFRTLGAPFKLPASPGGPTRAAPLLGQHDGEVLGALASGAPATGSPVEPSDAPLPLEGIRVANFGWVWAGPVVGQTLSFLGAEVYKIESRHRIDMTRHLPPFGEGVADPNRSLSNHACWAGNGSVTLNLKTEEGRDLARQLVARSDIVVENFGPGFMDRTEIGWNDLRAASPGLVMLSLPAAGLDGPLRDVRTYGVSLTSLTGLDSLTGYPDGPPIPFENAFSDPYNGILAAFSSLVALHHQRRTGVGQHVDFSQQEAMMQWIGPAFMDYGFNQRVAGPRGNQHPLSAVAPHGVFPCAGEDRWIAIAVVRQSEWRGLVAAMGDPDWAAEFETAELRLSNIEALHQHLADWTATSDDRELAAQLQAHGVAATPVFSVADLLDDPHYRERRTFIEVEHPLGFRETIYGAYVKLSRSRPDVQPGPMIGRDNDHVFKNLLGLDPDRYDELVEAKVIY